MDFQCCELVDFCVVGVKYVLLGTPHVPGMFMLIGCFVIRVVH